jgi:hypothetical protein
MIPIVQPVVVGEQPLGKPLVALALNLDMDIHPLRTRCQGRDLDQPIDQALAELGVAHHLREFLIEKPVWLPPVDGSVSIGKVERHELGKIAGQRRLPGRVEVVRGGIVLIHMASVPGISGPEDSAEELERTTDMRYVTSVERIGREEGRKEGRLEGEAVLLRRLLLRRFGAVPAWAEARLDAATTEQLEAWGDRVLDTTTLDEVFETQG